MTTSTPGRASRRERRRRLVGGCPWRRPRAGRRPGVAVSGPSSSQNVRQTLQPEVRKASSVGARAPHRRARRAPATPAQVGADDVVGRARLGPGARHDPRLDLHGTGPTGVPRAGRAAASCSSSRPAPELVQGLEDERVAAQQAQHEDGEQGDRDPLGDDDGEHAQTPPAGHGCGLAAGWHGRQHGHDLPGEEARPARPGRRGPTTAAGPGVGQCRPRRRRRAGHRHEQRHERAAPVTTRVRPGRGRVGLPEAAAARQHAAARSASTTKAVNPAYISGERRRPGAGSARAAPRPPRRPRPRANARTAPRPNGIPTERTARTRSPGSRTFGHAGDARSTAAAAYGTTSAGHRSTR